MKLHQNSRGWSCPFGGGECQCLPSSAWNLKMMMMPYGVHLQMLAVLSFTRTCLVDTHGLVPCQFLHRVMPSNTVVHATSIRVASKVGCDRRLNCCGNTCRLSCPVLSQNKSMPKLLFQNTNESKIASSNQSGRRGHDTNILLAFGSHRRPG